MHKIVLNRLSLELLLQSHLMKMGDTDTDTDRGGKRQRNRNAAENFI